MAKRHHSSHKKSSHHAMSHDSHGHGSHHSDGMHHGPLVRFESSEWCGIPRGSKIIKAGSRHYGKMPSNRFYNTTEEIDKQMESDRMDINKNHEMKSY